MSKGVKGLLAATILGTSVFGTTTATALAEEVKDKTDNKQTEDKKNTVDFDKKFKNLDKEREDTENKINESLEKMIKYEKEVQEIGDNTAELKAELKKIETEKEELEDKIKVNEEEHKSLSDELIKLGNERTQLETEKAEYIELLNDRLAVFFKNDKGSDYINLLGENTTINEQLDKFKKMNDITESDLEVIEDLLKVIQEIEDKEEAITKKVEEVTAILESLNKDYSQLEDLEIKTKLLENELNIQRQNVEELIKSEELSIQALKDKIQGLDLEEREVMNAITTESNNVSLAEYKKYLEEYRENVELTKERIAKDKERLEELFDKKEEQEKLLKEFRDELYSLKDYNEDLIVEREKELEKILELKSKYESELGEKQDLLKKLEDKKGASESEIKKLKAELESLEKQVSEQGADYESKVFDTSILSEIKSKKLDVEKKEKELNKLQREYEVTKLTEHEEKLIKELESSIKKYEEELKVFSGEGFVRPSYGQFTYGYGPRNLLKNETFHYGIDIANRSGTPILSVYEGTVVGSARNESVGYGNYIIVEHKVGNKIMTTLYGHLSSRAVKVGDKVKTGEVIGLMGSTGWSTGPHLHFEVYNGKKIGWSFKNIIDPITIFGDKNFSKTNLYKTANKDK